MTKHSYIIEVIVYCANIQHSSRRDNPREFLLLFQTGLLSEIEEPNVYQKEKTYTIDVKSCALFRGCAS